MDTKRRVGGFTIGGAIIAVCVRELFADRSPAALLEILGDVISPQSLYLFVIALGCGGIAYFGWPVFQWVGRVPQRWVQKRRMNSPESKFRRLHNVVAREFHLIEQDREYPHALGRSQASKFAQREILRFELSKCGIETPDPATDDDQRWYQFITGLVPLSQHGRLEDARNLGSVFARNGGDFRG